MVTLSIIIVNYNTFEITTSCLSSIYQETKGNSFEIILVDNNSNECDPERFLERFPKITLIKNQENVGFAGANNLGMLRANGKYLLLLNSDTIIVNNALDKCLKFLESSRPKIGLLGCKLVYEDGTVQESTFNPLYKAQIAHYFLKSNPIINKCLSITGLSKKYFEENNASETHKVGGVSGAFMLLRREVIDSCGMLDPDFFMYAEETEWCRYRIARKYDIVYFPKATVIHLEGKSGKSELMSRQANLSFSLYWYKTSYLEYILFLIIKLVNSVSYLLIYPVLKSKSKKIAKRFLRANFLNLYYELFEIPKYSNKFGARATPLKLKEIN